eukprot:3375154-Rhodomonas_salina.2
MRCGTCLLAEGSERASSVASTLAVEGDRLSVGLRSYGPGLKEQDLRLGCRQARLSGLRFGCRAYSRSVHAFGCRVRRVYSLRLRRGGLGCRILRGAEAG